jgi:hypothetical protein
VSKGGAAVKEGGRSTIAGAMAGEKGGSEGREGNGEVSEMNAIPGSASGEGVTEDILRLSRYRGGILRSRERRCAAANHIYHESRMRCS